ncbi:hypothetical protein Cgig2_007104 [Carnegiea gigantea]|uniref:Uncharacterized protein n=1 Tax=Carnegiea gigantea TaxID=171969 RepID=A0A9Q1Q9S9_9CARY|nr:hypothetical protein Cgig2_007104 [Carnegiea gigantea]
MIHAIINEKIALAFRTGASSSSSARYVGDKPPDPPDQLVSEELITPKPMDSEIADAKLMEVESMSPSPPSFPKASFKDIVRGDPFGFATAFSIVEQLHEALEEEILVPDTPLKVDFSPDQLQILRGPWSKTLMGKVLRTTVRYDVLSQRLPLLRQPHGTEKVGSHSSPTPPTVLSSSQSHNDNNPGTLPVHGGKKNTVKSNDSNPGKWVVVETKKKVTKSRPKQGLSNPSNGTADS